MKSYCLLPSLVLHVVLGQCDEGDPQPSVMWSTFTSVYSIAEFVFDDAIQVSVPPVAEDARQVPVKLTGVC